MTEADIPDDLDAELDGKSERRCRTLYEDGTFEFQYSGLGPKPEPSQTWHLIVIRGREALGSITFEAKLSLDGYFAEVEIPLDDIEE